MHSRVKDILKPSAMHGKINLETGFRGRESEHDKILQGATLILVLYTYVTRETWKKVFFEIELKGSKGACFQEKGYFLHFIWGV